MKARRSRLLVSISVFIFLISLAGTGWAITSLPTLDYTGTATGNESPVGSQALTLDSITTIDRANYTDGSFTDVNNTEESIIGATVDVTGLTSGDCSTASLGYFFFPAAATLTVTGPDSFVYMTADVSYLPPGSSVLYVFDGTRWLLYPPTLDASDPTLLNLSNIQTYTDGTHPSRYIDEIVAALTGAGTNLLGMTMILTPQPGSGTLCDGSGTTTFNVQGLIDGAPQVELATIEGTVFNDLNNNGVQDLPGEEGIPNISVFVDGVEVITDENGFYSTQVDPGTYDVVVDVDDPDLPAGTFPSTPISNSVTVAAGDTAVVDFGFAPSSTVGDTVFEDTNGNGIQDPGEPGIMGIEVTITGDIDNDGDTDIEMTTTDENGFYSFLVAPGSYTISINESTLPSTDYVNTTPGIMTDDVNFGEDNLNFDFGFVNLPLVPCDCDGKNGVTQISLITRGPTGLPVDIQVKAIDVATSTVLGEPELLSFDGTTVTTPVTDGGVSIINVFVEDGLVNVVMGVDASATSLPGGKLGNNTTFELWFDGGLVNSSTIHTACRTGCPHDICVGFVSGEFTIVTLTTATPPVGGNKGSIMGKVFKDKNANGTIDHGDRGIRRVKVKLYADDGDGVFEPAEDDLIKTRRTNRYGKYRFKRLPAGTYFVEVDETDPHLPSGYSSTTPNPAIVMLAANEHLTGINFGFAPPFMLGKISGSVFEDDNNNGTRDGRGERGIDKVDVDLYLDNGDGVFDPGTDTYIETMRTNKWGRYKFRALQDGTYFVDVDENDPDIPNNSTITTDDPAEVVIVNGARVRHVNFGFHYPQSGCHGGVQTIGLSTSTTSYPLNGTVTFTAKNKYGAVIGTISGTYSDGVPFSPVSDGVVTITDVTETNGLLKVEVLTDASSLSGGKLGPKTSFIVDINGVVHSEMICTSCSYYHPLAVGMVFDEFTIISISSP